MEGDLKILPIGWQSFEYMRTHNGLYVDKTDLMYRLVQTGKYYFLSRPRRFGKSLLISTLKAYFEGKKHLFEGLYVEHLEKDWHQHVVLHLDFVGGRYDSMESLDAYVQNQLDLWSEKYGEGNSCRPANVRLGNIIRKAHEKTGMSVVLLVDEYDKPLVEAMGNPELQEQFRSYMRGLYSNVKMLDDVIRFAMFTGVARFGQLSVFSGLNNLNDISLNKELSSLCGITEQEIKDNLMPYVEMLAEKLGLNEEETMLRLKKKYDGYHFGKNAVGVYNPFSLMSALYKKELDNFWYKTGTPTFLVEKLKQNHYDIRLSGEKYVYEEDLFDEDYDGNNPIPFLYQSGYLTMKPGENKIGQVALDFPNEEVEEGFFKNLLPAFMGMRSNATVNWINRLHTMLEERNINGFFEQMKVFYANIPYDLIRDAENFYQSILYVTCRLLGFLTEAEYKTSNGRIDMLLRTATDVYVIECKFDGTAEEALAQIENKNYPLGFSNEDKPVTAVGVNFSSETRNIDKWIVKKTVFGNKGII